MGLSGHFYSGMGLVVLDKQVFRGLMGCNRTPRFYSVTEAKQEEQARQMAELREHANR